MIGTKDVSVAQWTTNLVFASLETKGIYAIARTPPLTANFSRLFNRNLAIN